MAARKRKSALAGFALRGRRRSGRGGFDFRIDLDKPFAFRLLSLS
jgi:hypothetical protein